MTQQREPVLFVSHHSSKLQTAEHVERALNAKGIKCWIAPRDVDPGEPFDRAVRKAIAETDAMLLLFCSKSEKSRHVKRELILADQLGKAIIPLRLERIDPGELSYHLADSQWIDWLEQRDGVIDRIAAKAHDFQDEAAFEASPAVIVPASSTESPADRAAPGGLDPAAPLSFDRPGGAATGAIPPIGDATGPVSIDKPERGDPGHATRAEPLSAFGASPLPGAEPPRHDDMSGPAGGPPPGDPGAPTAPKKSRLWLWLLLGGLLLAGLIALVIFLVMRNATLVSEEFFEGRWSESDRCSQVYRFDSGGSFTDADRQRGEWSIEGGDTLVVELDGRTQTRDIERVGEDEVLIDGIPAYRCL